MDLNQARFNMIEQQVRPWEVLDPQVLELLAVVRREDFVPLAHRALAYADLEARTAHYAALRTRLIGEVLRAIPGAVLTGHPIQRLSSHASFVFTSSLHENLLAYLDERGIAASAASACKAGSAKPSSVLLALGYDPDVAARSLRLTVGLHTTPEDITYTVETLKDLLRLEQTA